MSLHDECDNMLMRLSDEVVKHIDESNIVETLKILHSQTINVGNTSTQGESQPLDEDSADM